MKTTKLLTCKKPLLNDVLDHLEVSRVDFTYPTKNKEVLIAFPIYKNKKDLIIRKSEYRGAYEVHVIES